MKSINAACILILLLVGNMFSQSAVTKPRNATAQFDGADHAAAVSELLAVEKQDRARFDAEELDYLLARHAEVAGETALAVAMFRRVSTRTSVLRPYALMHLARLFRANGNALLERLYLNELLTSTSSVPVSGARQRLAKLSIETGNYAEAIRLLASTSAVAGRAKSGSRTTRGEQALLAEAYLRSGDVVSARRLLTELLEKTPDPKQPDDAALTAVRMLDAIDGIDALSVAEHLRRATIFQFNREFAEAKLHFEAVIAAEPASSNAADAAFQIGRGFAQTYEFVEALNWYERILEQYSTAPVARDALLQTAAAYSRVGKTKEAKIRYQQFIDRYPSDEKLDRAYLNLVDIDRDLGLDQEALKWAAKTEEAFRGTVPEALAIFVEARIYLSRNDWSNAIVAIDRLAEADNLGTDLPGGTSRVELAFLRAYCLEQTGRFDDAVSAYLAIPDGRSEYYGWRATERLKALAVNEQAGPYVSQKMGQLSAKLTSRSPDERRVAAQSVLRIAAQPEVREHALNVLRSAVRQLPKYPAPETAKLTSATSDPSSLLATRLLTLGLSDEAVPEMQAAGRLASELANLYAHGGRVNLAFEAAESTWRKMPADFPVEMIPGDELRRLYPTPFRDELLRSSRSTGVDPRFMLSLMRQESRFVPDARSNAAARGLLQFIATTANKVAAKLDAKAFEQDDLFYPPTAIRFGSQYIKDLNQLFPDQPDAVAAAYNGGEDNVKRWLARANVSSPERYLPEIVFGQSKDYAIRVLANYRMYKLLYDEHLSPLQPAAN